VKWPSKIGDWSLVGNHAFEPGGQSYLEYRYATLAKESGLISSSAKEYSAGDRDVALTVYAFKDSSGAYEAYTVLAAVAARLKSVNVVKAKGNLVLWIFAGGSDLSAEDLKSFEAWEQSVGDGVASPPVANYLPSRNRETGTDRYALGPVAFREATKELGRDDAAELADQAGFNSGAETIFGKYKSGKDEATLLLIEYPTPQLAELHLKHMQRAILGMKNGTSVERKGSLLSIVLAPTSQEYAEKLRSAVNYETQVTWSEPSTTATDPPIMSTLVKIFIATGVFMVVTVVVGIAFGGVRIITKRLFPGKVFDRKNQIEVLQLGLSSKPIDPTDMY